jgi:hypothetical protein
VYDALTAFARGSLARFPGDWLVMLVAVLAPATAAVLLFWARRHPTLEPG